MHERYFFPADVLLIVLAAYFPKYFYVPVTMILISFFAYQPYLFQQSTFPLPVLALAVLGLIVVLVRQMLVELYLRNDTEEGGAI
jgi:Gpi18-like mannosyltransferase